MQSRVRPKLAVVVLLAAALLTAVAAFLSQIVRRPSETSPAPNNARRPADTRSPDATATRRLPVLPFVDSNAVTVAAPSSNDPAHAVYVHRRIAELNALAMKSDTVSRDIILSELRNSDREIRKGALEAAIQFSDRSVIPRLQEVADQTEDPAEKAEILEAIEYIKLPSLTEYLAEQKARRESMALTNPSVIVTNRPARLLLPPSSPSSINP